VPDDNTTGMGTHRTHYLKRIYSIPSWKETT